MVIQQTSGLFPVAQLPAAQVVSVQVHLINLENQEATVTAALSKLVGNRKEPVHSEVVTIPGDDRRILTFGSEIVEGQTLEVDVTLPADGFVPPASGVAPLVAVLTTFTGDDSTSLLQLISPDDFVTIPGDLP